MELSANGRKKRKVKRFPPRHRCPPQSLARTQVPDQSPCPCCSSRCLLHLRPASAPAEVLGLSPPHPFLGMPLGAEPCSAAQAELAAGRQLSSLRSAAAGARGSCWGVTDTSMTHFPCLFPLFPFSNPRTSFLLQSAFRPGIGLPAGSAQSLGSELPAVPQRLQAGTWGSRRAQHRTGRIRPRC